MGSCDVFLNQQYSLLSGATHSKPSGRNPLFIRVTPSIPLIFDSSGWFCMKEANNGMESKTCLKTPLLFKISLLIFANSCNNLILCRWIFIKKSFLHIIFPSDRVTFLPLYLINLTRRTPSFFLSGQRYCRRVSEK